ERITVYKNNTDGKGNSYGTHENYLVDRRTPFTRVVRDLTPFFVTRQIFTGAGKLGSESARGTEQRIVYQLTQRADFFEAEVALDNPVQALHEVSWDPTCRQTVKLSDGRRARPLELQWDYLDHAKKYVKENDATAENGEVLQRWEAVLTGIEEDPLSMHRELDWVAKYRLLTAYRERDGLDWRDPRLAMIALQYHDVRRSKGLYYRLVEAGKVERIVSDQEIHEAVDAPPEDTRAYFRGRCIERYPNAIA